MRRLAVIDAPSNLGLRPPADDAVPGVYKLPGALRDAGLLARLGAGDRGVVTPPRYHPTWDGVHVRNERALATYTTALADRIGATLDHAEHPLVLGGDCSVLLGAALALRRRGRFGLLFVDAHSDFRHSGNTNGMRAAAGEDLALVTGRGDGLTALDGLSPYIRDGDVTLVGVRDDDPHLDELRAHGFGVITASGVAAIGARAAVRRALDHRELDGVWLHLDADVVDPAILPAVDTPARGGLALTDVAGLLDEAAASGCLTGLDVTILDPDLDPGGAQVALLADALVAGLTNHQGVAR
jgi:arginase